MRKQDYDMLCDATRDIVPPFDYCVDDDPKMSDLAEWLQREAWPAIRKAVAKMQPIDSTREALELTVMAVWTQAFLHGVHRGMDLKGAQIIAGAAIGEAASRG